MRTVWVVCRVNVCAGNFEVNGVFATLEDALAICDEMSTAVPFEVGQDVTKSTTFTVHSLVHPEGVVVDSAHKGLH